MCGQCLFWHANLNPTKRYDHPCLALRKRDQFKIWGKWLCLQMFALKIVWFPIAFVVCLFPTFGGVFLSFKFSRRACPPSLRCPKMKRNPNFPFWKQSLMTRMLPSQKHLWHFVLAWNYRNKARKLEIENSGWERSGLVSKWSQRSESNDHNLPWSNIFSLLWESWTKFFRQKLHVYQLQGLDSQNKVT